MISVVIPALPGFPEMSEECIESYRETAKGKVEIILSEGKFPFAINVNNGIKRATGEIICVVNNDSIGLPGWDRWIEKAAMKGIATFSPSAECGWAFGAAREIWEKIGLLDEVFVNSYEDRDFFIRAAICGYRLILAPKVFALHQGGVSIAATSWGDCKENRPERIQQSFANKRHIQSKYPNLDVDHLINSKYFAFHGPEIMKTWSKNNAQTA